MLEEISNSTPRFLPKKKSCVKSTTYLFQQYKPIWLNVIS